MIGYQDDKEHAPRGPDWKSGVWGNAPYFFFSARVFFFWWFLVFFLGEKKWGVTTTPHLVSRKPTFEKNLNKPLIQLGF